LRKVEDCGFGLRMFRMPEKASGVLVTGEGRNRAIDRQQIGNK